MALRLSKALRSAIQDTGSFKHIMSNCFLKIYTNAQPATAEAAVTGTLLSTFSDASGTPIREVLSQGSVTFSGSFPGSLTALTVNSISIISSAVTLSTDATTAAAAVVTNINNNPKNLLFTASNTAGKVYITAKPGLGTLANGWTVASTVTTTTKADVNMGTETAGVLAVNGLLWGDSSEGTVVKLSTQTWSSTPVATGTAGWFRFEAAVADDGLIDTTLVKFRMDGSIASTGSELNIGNTTFTSGVPLAFDSFSIEFPLE